MRTMTFLLAVLVFLAGCAETVGIRTHPPDAKVYVEDKYIGNSPAELRAQAHNIQKVYRVRLEKDGYQTVDDVIPSHIAVGRIVLDGLLTCGIVWAFKGYRTFNDPANFELKPIATAVTEDRPSTGAVESHDAEIVNKLRRLQDLFNRHLIDQREYDTYKADILKGL